MLFETLVLITFVICLVAVLLVAFFLFLYSLKIKRNDIADVAWGSLFLIIAYLLFLLNPAPSISFKIALILISLWGVRLVFHIGTRFFGKEHEDPRYAKWREQWTWFKTRSFFQVFALQAALATVVMLPLISHFSADVFFRYQTPVMWPMIILGLLVWIVGFYYEVVGDWQLGQFIRDPKRYGLRRGDLMTKGLWSHTRHPNYFGEMTMWWGIWLILIPEFSFNYLAISAIGPAVITVLLVFVSGVRMTENHWAKNYGKKFEKYKESTPVLIPHFISLLKHKLTK